MNKGIRNSIAFLSQFFPLSFFMREVQVPPFFPFYHVVSDEKLDYINSYIVRSQKDFENELDYLLKYFKPVSLEQIIKSPAKNKMHLSFDDGLKSCSTVIAPILKRKGIPATFFVTPYFVDNEQIFHRFKRAILESKGVLTKGKKKYFIQEAGLLDELAGKHGVDFSAYDPYMSLKQIKQLHADGFLVGAHSLNHPEMWTLSKDEQYRQVVESMQWVIENFNPTVRAFSFPFTDDGISIDVFSRIEKSNVVDVTFGTAGLKFDTAPKHYQRIAIEKATYWSMKKTIHYEYLYFLLRGFLNKNKVNR